MSEELENTDGLQLGRLQLPQGEGADSAPSDLELAGGGAEEDEDLDEASGSSIVGGMAAAPLRSQIRSQIPTAKLAPAPGAGDGVFSWYVLRVQSGREDTISNNLKKKLALKQMSHLVQDVAVPKQKKTEIKEGKKRTRREKLFPGYVFVHANLTDELWYLFRDTSGIGDFVGAGQKPMPMMQAEVQKILSIMEEKEEPPQVRIDLQKNDNVKITQGPFENFDGIVEEVNASKGLVRVLVTIFNRPTPVDVEYWQIEKL